MTKKKVLIAGLAFAMVSAISIGGTMAYLTDKEQVKNTFTVGNVAIALEEESWDETIDHHIVPGTEFDKDPSVKNIGLEDAWIAVKIDMPNELKSLVESGKVVFDKLNDDGKWEQDSTDSYIYYYKTAAASDESTSDIFKKVLFSEDLTSEELAVLKSETNITVKAAAVQVSNMDYNSAKTVLADLLK